MEKVRPWEQPERTWEHKGGDEIDEAIWEKRWEGHEDYDVDLVGPEAGANLAELLLDMYSQRS